MPNYNDDNLKIMKKDEKSIELIEGALQCNVCLQQFWQNRQLIRAMTNAMYLRTVPSKTVVIEKGTIGREMFVCAKGLLLEYDESNTAIKTIQHGELFGELGLIYDKKRKTTVTASTECKLWVLDRSDYLKILKKHVRIKEDDCIAYLKMIPLLQELDANYLRNIWRVTKAMFYPGNEQIIRQGDEGRKFYIITGGTAAVTFTCPDGREKLIAKLGKGDFFGEGSLLTNEKRAGTVTAEDPGVECIIFDTSNFTRFLAPLKAVQSAVKQRYAIMKDVKEKNFEYYFIRLEELEGKGTMGNGHFGRIQLVQYKLDPNLVFAMKMVKRVDIVKYNWIDFVLREKEILQSCECPFIIRLYNTYKDSKYLYYLMEACLGGDLWYLLSKVKCLDETKTKFIAACVVEAIDYLHKKGVVYRDLKTENLLFDAKGYIKLVDFQYAKMLNTNGRTFTDIGISVYMAPEITTGNGYDKSVDYWSLGILIYEIMVGKLPFNADEGNLNASDTLKDNNVANADFPHFVTKSAKSIIMKLCKQNPTQRLGNCKNGISEIRDHKWFESFPWIDLQNQTLHAPYIPEIKSPTDLSNFQEWQKDKEIPPDEFGDWDQNF